MMHKIRLLHFGQCFACQRDTTLEDNQQPRRAYVCPHCGGENSVERVEANRDIHGVVCPAYGPRHEATP